MLRAILTTVGIVVVAIAEMGLAIWWWCDTSSGDWAWAPAKYVVGMFWGLAPVLAWMVTAFLVWAILHRPDGSPRWE
jgi:hypothetical protein